jgi:hypothetical protein
MTTTVTRGERTVVTPWWNKKLSGLRAKTRKPFNIVKTGQRETNKETLTCYNKEIRKAKQSSWRRSMMYQEVPGS